VAIAVGPVKEAIILALHLRINNTNLD